MATANTGISWRQRLGVGVKKYDNMDIIKGVVALFTQVFVIAAGSLLINNQLRLSEYDKNSSTGLNYTIGSILIVIGSLMTLYSIFLLIRPSRPAAAI